MLIEKKFEKFVEPKKNVFYVYGDNLSEATQIIDWFIKFNEENLILKSIEYLSLSEFVYVVEVNSKTFFFIAKSYYRSGKLPYSVREAIRELDKPDAIIFDKNKNKIIMGFETTATTLAGNATWQRSGRIINFLEQGIPFAFIAYYSKHDKSDNSPSKKPRRASMLFPLFFISLSLKYSVPALLGYYEHPDPNQIIDKNKLKTDMRVPIFQYLFTIIFENEDQKYLKEAFSLLQREYIDSEDNSVEIATTKEFGENALQYIKDVKFPEKIISDLNAKSNVALFIEDELIFDWKPKKHEDAIKQMFPNIKFYQLSKNCKAGITFETEKLIDILSKKNNVYAEDYIKNNINNPTIIIQTKLTKNDSRNQRIILTDDPYNGEITAFSNLYLQSFPNANVMILLLDHSKKEEYFVASAKSRKTYKTIDKYVDLVVDMDYQLFSRTSETSRIESRTRYEKTFITEDDVTSFLGSVLKSSGIAPSFLNPPSGSWSDVRLFPTDDFYYYNRNDERADIAFFNPINSIYYVGESKKDYTSLKRSLDKEYEKTKFLAEIIGEKLDYKYDIKLFAIFYGTKNQAREILLNSEFDIAVTLSDSDEIKLEVLTRNEIFGK